MELASHLKMSLQRCQQETTSNEFLDWCWFLQKKKEEKYETHDKWEWYLAQIAFEAFNSFKSKRTLSIKDFLLKWNIGSKQETLDEEQQLSEQEEQKARAVKQSKAAWLAIAGLDAKGRPLTGERKPKIKRRLPPSIKNPRKKEK